MKFLENIYNYALYGDILIEEEVAQNWGFIKNELGIDLAGNKIEWNMETEAISLASVL